MIRGMLEPKIPMRKTISSSRPAARRMGTKRRYTVLPEAGAHMHVSVVCSTTRFNRADDTGLLGKGAWTLGITRGGKVRLRLGNQPRCLVYHLFHYIFQDENFGLTSYITNAETFTRPDIWGSLLNSPKVELERYRLCYWKM